MKEPLETEGVLDHCRECGSNARFVINKNHYMVECSECGNAINYQSDKCDAMITWNKEQRLIIKNK